MPKLPKQYKRENGSVTPEKIDIDSELERKFERANRDKSREREEERLKKSAEKRKEERHKERERERESRHHRKDRKRRSRSRSRDRRRRSRSRERSPRRSRDSRRRRSRSRSRDDRRKRESEDKKRIEEITKETGLKVPEYLAGSTSKKLSFMETQAKRKALWSKKSEDTSQAKLTDQQKLWANLNIGDEKQTNKFQKLMGAAKLVTAKNDTAAKESAEALLQKQAKMFSDFDAQYSASQVQTHFGKGQGFGKN